MIHRGLFIPRLTLVRVQQNKCSTPLRVLQASTGSNKAERVLLALVRILTSPSFQRLKDCLLGQVGRAAWRSAWV